MIGPEAKPRLQVRTLHTQPTLLNIRSVTFFMATSCNTQGQQGWCMPAFAAEATS
jgi:hypothetical protein